MRIRLPQDVKDWLKLEAEKNMRTQNGEIVLALRARMAAEGEGLDSNAPSAAS